MKYIVAIIIASSLAGCVSASSGHHNGGYFPPSPEYTHTYTAPRPHPAAQKVCVWEDYYNYRIRQWVREERCRWR
jgi:hypothetical protein